MGMGGDFPPSSSVIRFSVSAEPFMIPLPVEVSPVNAILSMPGCSTIACPTVEPGPVTTFMQKCMPYVKYTYRRPGAPNPAQVYDALTAALRDLTDLDALLAPIA